jgi:predicted anti-sigma-YlaC factor YlaD
VIEQNGRIHDQVAELLSAYIDGEVNGDERALVETHLATCVACARDLATLRQTVTMLRQLPPLATPRPFTLRQSDVVPIRPASPAWWQLPWAQGLVAAAAVLLCVAAVGGVLLLGRTGMVGTPAAPTPVAVQAPAPAAATAEKELGETTVAEAEKVVEGEKEAQQPVEAPASRTPSATEEAAREAGAMVQEAPAAPAESTAVAQNEGVAAADEGEATLSSTAPRAAAGAAAAPPTPTTPPLPPEATPVATASTLLEVENLNLQIEPGVIRVSGQLPLPEGRKLLAELWRNGQPIEWATSESQQATVKVNGQFSLELKANPGLPDFNLFGTEPADYEIRIRPVDPPAPVEARIPFDTYGPLPPSPTNSP